MFDKMLLATGLAGLGLVLQGCGGGGGDESATPAPGPPITTTTTTTAPEYGATVTAVTYNLFWWCVSGNPHNNPEIHNENCKRYRGGEGFKELYDRIKEQMPFDLIGFSEILDVHQVMAGTGLEHTFDSYLAPPQSPGVSDSGFAWSKQKFEKLGEPGADLMSKDMYGERWLGYVRLRVKGTAQTILFANTHGGLGVCGGAGGQNVYKNFIESVEKHRESGDSVIVTGDFNCRPDELVMKLLMQNFSTVHDHTQLYDNILRSNWVRLDTWDSKMAPPSDHSIVKATMSLPSWAPSHVVPDPPPAPSPGPKPPSPGQMSKCADLKCGNHDSTCWCTPSCVNHHSCCPDYKDICTKADTDVFAFV